VRLIRTMGGDSSDVVACVESGLCSSLAISVMSGPVLHGYIPHPKTYFV
jgi:hypothetical protein